MHRTIPPLATIILAVGLAGCASGPSQEGTGDYLHDAAITSKIKSAYVGDPKVSALGIHVKTFNGTVQLSGFAADQGEIDRAVEIARSVNGVNDVNSEIQLKEK